MLFFRSLDGLGMLNGVDSVLTRVELVLTGGESVLNRGIQHLAFNMTVIILYIIMTHFNTSSGIQNDCDHYSVYYFCDAATAEEKLVRIIEESSYYSICRNFLYRYR